MTPPFAAAGALAATLAAWRIARRATSLRGGDLGAFPRVLPFATCAVAAFAAQRATLDAAAVVVIAAVGVAAVADARTGAIADRLTRALVLATLAIALVHGTPLAACAGAATAGGGLLALYVLTRRRGIGLGDVKLAAGIGAGLGATLALAALGAAFVAGGVYGVWLLATRRARRDGRVRFGPFLAGGTYVALLMPAELR
jgi:leader peptidase (prepilin peptidase)/N-methyltransferase